MEVVEGGVDKIGQIAKRDFERKLNLQKRKDDKDSLSANNEKLGFFEDIFTTKRTDIENLIAKSNELQKTELADHFNHVSKEILLLQKYVASSNIFLRTYDIKKCQETLQELTNKAKELEDELLPKRKFGFKNKTKPKPMQKKEQNRDEVDFHKTNPIQNVCGFVNKTGENLIMKGAEIYKNDVTAENLENCKIQFFGCPSTLHLGHLRNCFVFTGPVSTSIFAENCSNCTFVIACQQLRLHSSKNINIYLHVTSRAIMEDCNNIYLAPYNLHYNGLEKDFEESGLDKSTNNWKCIDDFNWLNVGKQSPNWALLEQEKLVDNWDNM